MKRLLGLLVLFFVAVSGFAQTRPTPGSEYRVIEPPQPAAGTKIELLEFFNYACPHCYAYEPYLKIWLKKKPSDVEFRYVPAVFNEGMLPLARLYYTLEEMALLPKLHDRVYEAIHEKNIALNDRAVLMKWIGGQGVDVKKFEATYDSFSVGNKAQRAAQLTRNYRIPGTPYLVVDGRYLTGPSMTPGADGNVDFNRFARVLSDLIDMARRKG